ncbi:MAG: hypothetical protein QM648_02190, partial [Solirubrobacterales bacterium]
MAIDSDARSAAEGSHRLHAHLTAASKLLAAVVVAGVVAFAGPSTASGHQLTVSSTSSVAGSHPVITIAHQFSSGQALGGLKITLPQGLNVATAAAAPCARALAILDHCDLATPVGTTQAASSSLGTGAGKVYLLDAVAGGGDPGLALSVRFGSAVSYVALGSLKYVRLSTGEVVQTIEFTDLETETGSGDPIVLDSLDFSLDGAVGASSNPLVTNPSTCPTTPAVFSSVATTAAGSTSAASAAYPVTGCASISFAPVFEQIFDDPVANHTTAGEISLDLPPENSSVKSLEWYMPTAIWLEYPAFGAAIDRCPGSAVTTTPVYRFYSEMCPDQARVGFVHLKSPLFPTDIEGSLYVVNKAPIAQFAIDFSNYQGLFASGAAASWPQADTSCDEFVSGYCSLQFVLRIQPLPQIPISRLEVSFGRSGRVSHAGAAMPRSVLTVAEPGAVECESPGPSRAVVTPWARSTSVTANDSVSFSGCDDGSEPPETTWSATPTSPTNTGQPSFSFTSDQTDAEFRCKVDGLAYAPCESPFVPSSALADGEHRVRVRAVTAAGIDPTPAEKKFVIDTHAPAAPVISASPANPTSSKDASFEFSGEASSPYSCKVDAGSYAACESPWELTDLSSGEHSISIRQTDAAGNVGSPAEYSWTVQPSNDPTPIDQTGFESFEDQVKFVYDGPDAQQQGVDEAALDSKRIAVMRGQVRERGGAVLSGVTVTVADHPEFGETYTDERGEYSMVVNGGGDLNMVYVKSGYLPAARKVDTTWHDYSWTEDAVLVPLAQASSEIDLGSPIGPAQTAQGPIESDADGSRRATLIFSPGTEATMSIPDVGTLPLSTLHVRATEFTVGPDGPEAMPYSLPKTTSYTYAAEFSVDEAVAAGATGVQFSRTVASYTDNFLGFPVGTTVPSGYYDTDKSSWLGDPNGRVVRVVSNGSGGVTLSVSTDGSPASQGVLDAMGVTSEELEQVADKFAVGKMYWRVPLTHFSTHTAEYPNLFSPKDYNWLFGFSDDADADPRAKSKPEDCGCNESGASVLGVEEGSLTETVPVSGTDFALSYNTRRSRDSEENRNIDLSLTGTSISSTLQNITVSIVVAGQRIVRSVDPSTNAGLSVDWDGLDAFGRKVQGGRLAEISAAYEFTPVYNDVPRFAVPSKSGSGAQPFVVLGRDTLALEKSLQTRLGTYDPEESGLGGWMLSAEHHFDPETGTLYSGDGSQRSAQSVGNVIRSVTGSMPASSCGLPGEGLPAMGAWVCLASSISSRPDGTLLIGDLGTGVQGGSVTELPLEGVTKSLIAPYDRYGGYSNLALPYCGEPINQYTPPVFFRTPDRAAPESDGSTLILDQSSCFLWRRSADGTFTRVAGGGPAYFSVDGVPATDVTFRYGMRSVAADRDGNVYVADLFSIYKITPDGLIARIVGTGEQGHTGDGGLAAQSAIRPGYGLAIGNDGTLYFTETNGSGYGGGWIRSVSPTGVLGTVMGDGNPPSTCPEDGAVAKQSQIGSMGYLSMAADGSILYADCGIVSLLTPGGTIKRVAGTDHTLPGVTGIGDGENPLRSYVSTGAFAEMPNHDIVVAGGNQGIRMVSRIPANYRQGSEYFVPSDDGSEIYVFDAEGRQLQTFTYATGELQYSFHRDDEHRLTDITDRHGRKTEIHRTEHGTPIAIEAPYGQQSQLELDENGKLSDVYDPLGRETKMTYWSDGRIKTFTSPGGGEGHMTYDGSGRIARDTNALNGRKDLDYDHWYLRSNDSTQPEDVSQSTVTTAAGVKTDYYVSHKVNGEYTREVDLPDGTTTTTKHKTDNSTEQTLADGTKITKISGADPILGMQAPIDVQTKVDTPDGLEMLVTRSRTANRTNPSDPLSMTGTTDTVTVNGKTSVEAYDKATRTYTSTSPAGRTQSTEVTLDDEPKTVSIPGLATTYIGRDAHARITSVSQGSRSSTIEYGANGLPAKTTDALGRETTFDYDAAGQVTAEHLPGGRTVSYAYDEAGNLAGVTPPGRPEHGFTYNLLNLVVAASNPSIGPMNGTTTYSYTGADRHLTKITRPTGEQINLAYDTAGRQKTTTSSDGVTTIGYSGDTGNLTSITGPFGENLAFTYDGSLPTSSTQSGEVAGTAAVEYNNDLVVSKISAGGASATYGYDADGLLTSAGALTLERSAGNGLLAATEVGGAREELTYNTYGEPSADSTTLPGGAEISVTYERDAGGRITAKHETTSAGTHETDYTYDAAGRLATVERNGVQTAAYSYDDNSNRTSVTRGSGPSAETTTSTYNDRDQLTSSGDISYAYNANGELTNKTDGGTGDETTFAYTAAGDLKAATLPDGTQITYVLDGLGRRVGKKVNGALTQGFVYAPGIQGPVAETDASGSVTSTYVYGTRTNVPDLVIRGSNTYKVITDQLGSPRMIVNSSTGAVAQEITYDEFGRVTSDTSPGFTPFGFAGGLYDTDTRLTHFGAREYDAESGR